MMDDRFSRDKTIQGDEVHGDKVMGDKIVITRSQAEELHDYLAWAITAFEARTYQIVSRPPGPPDQPYKFLYPFEIEDESIFFGRGRAVEELYQRLVADRLTVLHARSGAGKTSLLNAGLSPRLIRQRRLPIYARAYEDPALAIKRAIVPPSLGSWPESLPELTLHEFLGLACQHLSRQTQELVIILDQFEEFFVFWPEREQRQLFVDALADCYEDKALPVRFLVGIRGDYFTHLATCQNRLPHIFHNEYYLEAMTREEARAAITGPVVRLDQPVAYEQALLDSLLDDLARGGMELPHLQIVCTRLYETLAEGESIITLAAYEKLGWAEGVLGSYLKAVLDRLPNRGSAIAREVLKELVSSEATKRVLGYDTLRARVEAEQGVLDEVLARLVDARLLRRDESEVEVIYEMGHEYLIEEIRTWIDQADLMFKQVEELLMREVANWRVHRTLIPEDRLELLHAQRERFRGFDDETSECLLQSELEADFPVDDWVKLVSEIGEKVLLAALAHKRQSVRWGAAHGLGLFWVLPAVSELGSRVGGLRQAAAETLGKLGDPRAVKPLIAALKDENAEVRQAAAEALGEIGDPHAVEPLIAVLKDENAEVRQAAAEALGEIGDSHVVEPLIASLGDKDINVRRAATDALVEIGQSVQPLISALGDELSAVCEAVARALGEIGDPRAVQPLIGALGQSSFVHRAAFGKHRDPDAIVRRAAAEALGKIGDPRAVQPLIGALGQSSFVRRAVSGKHRDSDAVVRRAAAWALGELADPRAVEPLISALGDEASAVREAAARALGEIGDPRAVQPLIGALDDEDWDVRRTAAKSLNKIDTPEALAALERFR
jgi:HEAT repeat protein